MRPASATDFRVDVDGIGSFVFAQRKMADNLRVHVEYCRITEGVFPTSWLDSMATAIATFRVLMVSAPAGFDPEELDPLDPKTDANVTKIMKALDDKEHSFRQQPAAAGQGSGTSAG